MRTSWLMLALLGAAGATQAAGVGPAAGLRAFDGGFAVRNEAALSQVFALPPIGTPQVLAPGQGQFRADLDWTNEFVDKRAGDETIVEDGETQRYTLDFRRGFAGGPWGGFELGLTLPVIVNDGGVLDGVIQNYHSALGLPDGGRKHRRHGQVLYRYTRGVDVPLDLHSSRVNLADMTLSAGVQAKPGLALRAELKLPTGDSNQLDGGNVGGALWLDYNPFVGVVTPWFGFISLGGSYNATSDVLPGLQRRAVLLGGAGAGYHLTPAFSLLVQLYAHSPLWKHTALSALRKMGLQGTFGGRYVLSSHVAVEAGFQEDLITDTSPDFSIHLGVVVR